MAMSNVLVLGAGFGGATAAYLLARRGYDVTVLEGAPYPGGGTRTQWYGGHPYTFGPRIFFSRDEQVISHITELVPFRHFYTRSFTYVATDGQTYNYPLQWQDIPLMPDHEQIEKELKGRENVTPDMTNFETYWKSMIGPSLYGKFVDDYSKKMWGIESNSLLSASWQWVNRGTPIRDGDVRLYGDQFQGYPDDKNGYNVYFDNALALDNITTVYECWIKDFDPDTLTVRTSQGEFSADVVVNTVHVDALYGFEFGRLQYWGRDLLKIVLPVEYALPPDITWVHYSGDEPFTRVTEMKKITNHQSPHTLLTVEIPSEKGRFYPVQTEMELEKFGKYKDAYPENFYSIGRPGSFAYKGIPDSIRDALDAVDAITA